jgi:hypothetical protein
VSGPHEVPEDVGEGFVAKRCESDGEAAEEVGSTSREHIEDTMGIVTESIELIGCGRPQREVRNLAGVQRNPAVVSRERAMPLPEDITTGGEFVEQRRVIVRDSGGQDEGLECARRERDASELLNRPH